MAARVLVCIEDTGVAHVVAARLMKDGFDGVVVERPGLLLDEAKRGLASLVVQDRYPSGEAASSLLRQIRVARGEAVPAVLLMSSELPAGERHVLEKQYKVRDFLRAEASPIQIAEAVEAAASRASGDAGAQGPSGKPTEHVAAPASSLAFTDDDPGTKTVEVEPGVIDRLRAQGAAGLAALQAEEARGADARKEAAAADERGLTDGFDVSLPTGEVVDGGLSQLPAPGGDDDLLFASGTFGGGTAGGTDVEVPVRRAHEDSARSEAPNEDNGRDARPAAGGGSAADGLSDLDANSAESGGDGLSSSSSGDGAASHDGGFRPDVTDQTAARPTAITVEKPSGRAAGAKRSRTEQDPEEQVAMQETQKTNADLKKALLAEKRRADAAEKRVEELEAQRGRGDTSVAAGVPTEGVFEDLRYPALLARCRTDAFTGAVVMQSGGATRTVYLRDGLPVAFSSSEPGERIGKVLVTQGRITDEQYMKAATRMVERSIKLTDALVELSLIDGEALAIEQRNLARDQIIQAFEVVQGRFTVQAGAAPDANTPTFDFGPGEIYVQGYRRYAPQNEMMAVFETLRDRYLTANSRLANFRPKLGLNSEDERLLRLLGEALTVEEAVERATVTAEGAARLISALQALELVEEWSPGVEQFRSRLRGERQRHAEEIAQIHAESRRREDKLLEQFELALSKIGSAPVDDRKKAEAKAEAKADAKPEPAKTLDLRDDRKEERDKRFAPLASSAAPAASSPVAAASAAAPGAPFPSAASSAPGAGTSARAGSATNMAAAGSPPASSAAAPASPAAASSTAPAASAASNSAAAPAAGTTSTVASAAATSAKAKQSTDLSLADMKYKEGLDQAKHNKLDDAELTLREAVRLDASKPEYLTALARVLLNNPRYERVGTLPVVRSLLDRAVQIAPDLAEAKELHQQVVKEMTPG